MRAGLAYMPADRSSTALVRGMTVAQNLFLGQERFYNRLRGIYIAAQQFLQSLNFNVDPWASVASLGAAKKQMVEIARAANVRVEPSPTSSPVNSDDYFRDA